MGPIQCFDDPYRVLKVFPYVSNELKLDTWLVANIPAVIFPFSDVVNFTGHMVIFQDLKSATLCRVAAPRDEGPGENRLFRGRVEPGEDHGSRVVALTDARAGQWRIR